MPLFTDAIASMRRRPSAVPAEAVSPSDWFSWTYPTGVGAIEMADGLTASYTAIYRSQPWVWAAINTIARGMMRMPVKVYDRDDDGNKQRIRDGGLYRLVEKRPCYGWTPSRHREMTIKLAGTYGNAFVVKLGMSDESSEPVDRMIAPSTGWKINADDSYTWTARNGEPHDFPRWKIEHYRFGDPDADGMGISPLEPLRQVLANDDAARRFSIAAFKNGARPQNILKTDQTLKQSTADALKAQWVAVHGGADAAFQLAVLQQGLDYAVHEYDLDKAAVVGHRELTPVEVAAVFGIPASMIGWTKDANFASVDMYHTMLYQDSLGAWVVMYEETLQSDLVDPTPAYAGQFVEVDMNAVMRGDLETRYRAYATGITSGFLTQNKVLALENEPPSKQPGADDLHLPMNLSGAVGAQLAEDTGQEDSNGA